MWWSDASAQRLGTPRRAALPRRALLLGVATAALGGCGFQLRQAPKLSFRSIALTGFGKNSPMAAALKQELARQVQVLDAPDKAEVVLHTLQDKRERGVVAQTAAAQVRELQLRLRLEFRVTTASGQDAVPRTTLLLSRDLNYSENFALAKEAEENALWREMQADLVTQVLRRLSSVRA